MGASNRNDSPWIVLIPRQQEYIKSLRKFHAGNEQRQAGTLEEHTRSAWLAAAQNLKQRMVRVDTMELREVSLVDHMLYNAHHVFYVLPPRTP